MYELVLPLNSVLRLGMRSCASSRCRNRGSCPSTASSEMRRLVGQLERIAPSDVTVMLLGESGTGKEVVARALHTLSPRVGQPFLAVNCAALSPALVESELFGHEKGAFTGADAQRQGAFEAADGGTLLLDEVGELPLELQAKLLRVLESGEVKRVGSNRSFRVDVRVVAATHRDLLTEVSQGRFRADLYYRLSVLPLMLPSLRERRGDIPLLAEHFVRSFKPREVEVTFTPAALKKLKEHSWPGNVRELRNVVQRALLLSESPVLDAASLNFEKVPEQAPKAPGSAPSKLLEGLTLHQMVQQWEREAIEEALRVCNHHRGRAAKLLGLSRSAFFERLKAWGYGHEGEQAR